MKDASPNVELQAFTAMLRQLRDPMLIALPTGEVLAANVAASDALGISVPQIEGARVADFTPGREPVELRPGTSFPMCSSDGQRYFGEVRALTAERLLVRLSGGPGTDARTRAFDDSRARLQGLTVQSAEAAASDRSRRLLEEHMSLLGAFAGGIFVITPEGDALTLAVSVGYSAEAAERFKHLPLVAPLPLTDCVRSGKAVVIGKGDEHTARYPELTRQNPVTARSAIACLPLEVSGKTIGALGLGFPQPWAFTDEDREHLEAAAQACARSIAGEHIEVPSSGELDAPARLERLHAFTGSLAGAVTTASVAELVVDMGMAALSAQAGALWLLTDDGVSVDLVRASGTAGPRPEHHVRMPVALPARMPVMEAIARGVPVWVESCAEMERRFPETFRAFSKGVPSSLASVPLFAQGRVIGALTFRYDRERTFRHEERAFMKLLAWHAAQAVERARLYSAEHEARRSAELSRQRSDFTAHASMLLSSSLELSQILKEVARAAVPRVADWCIVQLGDLAVPPVVAHADPSREPFVLELSHRFRTSRAHNGITAVLATGKSELYRSIDPEQVKRSVEPELAAALLGAGLGSSMVVPITAKGKTLGAIALNTAAAGRNYDEADLAMAEDVGRRVGLALDNARLYSDAREADRRKEEFLAMLSHELRNPLAPIVTALELMELRGAQTFPHERAMVSRHVHHMLRLVDDLLDVSRITRGKIDLELERCELGPLVSVALEMVDPLVQSKRHRVEVVLPDSPLAVEGDRARLTQVLANLLSNAAKYTPPGGQISVNASDEASEVVVRVRDSGVGMPPDMLEKAFELFAQADVSLDRKHGGLGIGLTVVKRLVELHGGSVKAHSDGPGKGTELVLRLPRSTRPAAAAATQPAAPLQHLDAPLKVLVVDDNEDAASIIGDALEALGCSARVEHSGAAALSAFSDFHPDVALLDIGLPEMDGYELARRIRQLSRTTRLVAVTGYGKPSDRAQAKEAGFDEHVLKPLSLELLREVVGRSKPGVGRA